MQVLGHLLAVKIDISTVFFLSLGGIFSSLSLLGIKIEVNFKDARSVYLYPYNRSQILEYVTYTTNINIAKGLQNSVTNNVFSTRLNTTKTKQNQT